MVNPAQISKVIIPAILGFCLVWISGVYQGKNEEKVSPGPEKPFQNIHKRVVLSEELDYKAAKRILLDQNIERPERNEAANRIRQDDPEVFLAIAEQVLDRDSETGLFKSWMLQHVGLAAAVMKDRTAIFWIARLQGIVSDRPVGSPMWREGIFALAAFSKPEVHIWIVNYIKTLNTDQYRKNEYLIKELLAPPKKHGGVFSSSDLKDTSL